LFPILLVGIAALVWSADRFVEGASGIAEHLGLSPLIIGLTVVSIGTSAPEIFVSANAALDKSTGLAVGNALGSNLANMGLVLGITALICPLAISPAPARREGIIMLFVTAMTGAILFDSFLGRFESILLLACLVLFIGYLIRTTSGESKQTPHPTSSEITNTEITNTEITNTEITSTKTTDVAAQTSKPSLQRSIITTLYGLVLLIISARILVWSATGIATNFGVSDLVIGVTVVAVGNVLGSNIFNILAVLPVAGVIYPMEISDIDFLRDFGTVFVLSLLFVCTCLWKTRTGVKGILGRPAGIGLLAIYIGYYYWLLA